MNSDIDTIYDELTKLAKRVGKNSELEVNEKHKIFNRINEIRMVLNIRRLLDADVEVTGRVGFIMENEE